MPEQVRVVFHAPHDVRVEPAHESLDPGDGEVVVKVEACAICGSDLKTWENGNPRIQPPRTMGHEFCGTITAVGRGVDAYGVGRRVSMATTMGCGKCSACRRGMTNLCYDLEAIGFHHDGAMAPFVRIPSRGVEGRNLVDVGDTDPVFASLSEPISCVMNSLSRLDRRVVESMLVIGLGPLGLLHALIARERGVPRIVGVARPGARFETARSFGLDEVVTPQEVSRAVERWTSGNGFDAVIVTAPSAEMQAAAPEFAAKSGAVSLFAGLPRGQEMITLNSRTIHYGEQIVYGTSDSTPVHVAAAVDWIGSHAGLLEHIVTHRLPLGEFLDGIRLLKSRNALKVVCLP